MTDFSLDPTSLRFYFTVGPQAGDKALALMVWCGSQAKHSVM